MHRMVEWKMIKKKLKKVKDIEMPTEKIERNYLQDMTLADARLWFR